jgi:hypothetical protein
VTKRNAKCAFNQLASGGVMRVLSVVVGFVDTGHILGAQTGALISTLTFSGAAGLLAFSVSNFVCLQAAFFSCTPSGLSVRSRHPTGHRPDGRMLQ